MNPPTDNRVLALQAKANRSTAGHWEYFASHRAEVHKLLVSDVGAGGGRLCVLGAGNCNDLDLASLTAVFREVHLVDVDRAALEAAVRRQGVGSSPGMHLHVSDLTGIADLFNRWEQRPPVAGDVEQCVRRSAEAPLPELGGPFDVVLSPCLLSQLVGYASDTLGRLHPQFHPLLLAIRTRHMRLLVELVAPGGAGVLVSDLVSSDAAPELPSLRKDQLPDFARRLPKQGRGFPGISADAIGSALRDDPTLAPLVAHVQFIPPWVWHLGPRRTFLVYALRFRRARVPVLTGVQKTGLVIG
jgi:hypothetical protein